MYFVGDSRGSDCGLVVFLTSFFSALDNSVIRFACRAQHMCLVIFSTVLMVHGSCSWTLGSRMSWTNACSLLMSQWMSIVVMILSRMSVPIFTSHLSKWVLSSSSLWHNRQRLDSTVVHRGWWELLRNGPNPMYFNDGYVAVSSSSHAPLSFC